MEIVLSSRRQFIKKLGLGIGGIAASAPLMKLSALSRASSSKHPICYFTKHLQWLDFDDLGIALNEAGFDGADLTIRKGGHIEPENVAAQLPKAVSSLQKHGISIPMAVTRISDPEQKDLGDMLQAFADNGVSYYRMGYLEYDPSLSTEQNIQHFRKTLGKLAEMNAKYGVCGAYQNHAGTRLGASIWDLLLALEGIDPDALGCQFDVRHATFEGGRSWVNDFRAIHAHIRTTVVKDFHWTKNEKGKWTNHNTLMGEGMVDFDTYFRIYKELGIKGPISNHSEYPLITKQEEGLSKSEKMKIAISRLQQDVQFTKKYIG